MKMEMEKEGWRVMGGAVKARGVRRAPPRPRSSPAPVSGPRTRPGGPPGLTRPGLTASSPPGSGRRVPPPGDARWRRPGASLSLSSLSLSFILTCPHAAFRSTHAWRRASAAETSPGEWEWRGLSVSEGFVERERGRRTHAPYLHLTCRLDAHVDDRFRGMRDGVAAEGDARAGMMGKGGGGEG